jgi:16S rRNA (guanine527-N7)-methyltransferase
VLEALTEVLDAAKRQGFLGPGPVEAHVVHAEGFAACWAGPPPSRATDLGSGAGIPALVLALRWPESAWVLIESAKRRCDQLRLAVEALGLDGRIRIVEDRAEAVGRSELRGTQDLVTARSFAPPAVTAECGAPLLQVGGRLIVSEPPVATGRWDDEGLALLGLGPAAVAVHRDAHFAVVRKERPIDERYPRRVGIPTKRPQF